jgi:hypothetical protein
MPVHGWFTLSRRTPRYSFTQHLPSISISQISG